MGIFYLPFQLTIELKHVKLLHVLTAKHIKYLIPHLKINKITLFNKMYNNISNVCAEIHWFAIKKRGII